MSKLICPICEHPHIIQFQPITIQSIHSQEATIYCPEIQQFVIPPALFTRNLTTLNDQIRMQHHLLTSAELRQIRAQWQLSLKEMAVLCNCSEQLLEQYEQFKIPEKAFDQFIKATFKQPQSFKQHLQKHQHQFSTSKYQKLQQLIAQAELKQLYNTSPTIYTGFQSFQFEKLEQLVHYILSMPFQTFKVKLYKLLWYIDNYHFKKFGKAITGLRYQHLPYGAVPIGNQQLFIATNVQTTPIQHYGYETHALHAPTTPSLSQFTSEEQQSIEDVLHKFKYYSSVAISLYMHEEAAYQHTSPQQLISFEWAKQLKKI